MLNVETFTMQIKFAGMGGKVKVKSTMLHKRALSP